MTRQTWIVYDQKRLPLLGYIPHMLSSDDPRSLAEQINENYAHGGGWNPMIGKWKLDPDTKTIQYPGDPAYKPIAATQIRDELLIVYADAWVCIVNLRTLKFEVSRMD